MFKKNLFVFTVIFAFMFVNIGVVRAATGLYCIYEKSDSRIMLVQDTSGKCSVYNDKYIDANNFDYDMLGWQLETSNCLDKYSIPSAFDTSSGKYVGFSKCPIYYHSDSYEFSDEKSSLANRYEKIKDDVYDGKSNELPVLSFGNVDSYLVDKDSFDSDNYKTQWILTPESDGYTQSCLYSYGTTSKSNAHLYSIQMDIDFKSRRVRMSGIYYSHNPGVSDKFERLSYAFTPSGFGTIEKNFSGFCPIELYVSEYSTITANTMRLYFSFFNNPKSFTNANMSLNSFTLTNSSPVVDFSKITINKNTITINGCSDIFGDELLEMLRDIVNFVKIAIPLILIGLGVVDFSKAVFSSKEDDMKKTASKFIKRVIIAIAIFFIPSFLNVILTIAHSIWSNIDPSLCGILEV